MGDRAVVRAAGGVVFRRLDGGPPEVALIHRPAYDDWSFPKGKLLSRESHKTAALREVQEETGLVCRLGTEVGDLRYRDQRGRDKVVRYWLMEPVDGDFAPNAEVDELRWMPLPEAREVLSYPHDRLLLDCVPIQEEAPSGPGAPAPRATGPGAPEAADILQAVPEVPGAGT